MKQYKITSDHLNQDSEDDAYLSPNDPIHELKIAHYLNGLGSEARLSEYRAKQEINTDRIGLSGSEKRQYERVNNIRPGDPEWFQLWFGKSK